MVIVDNASRPSERRMLEDFAARHSLTLIQNDCNVGYAAGNNVGIAYALNEAVLIMNNDAAAEPGPYAS